MTATQAGLVLVGVLLFVLGLCWLIVREENAADRRDEEARVARQLDRIRRGKP